MKLIRFSKVEPFLMIRASLTDLLNGEHLDAGILHNLVWMSESVLNLGNIEEIDLSQPGPWIWHSERDIGRLLVPYRGKPLYGNKAIREAMDRLVAKRYIDVRFDPVDKLNRRRQARLACPARLQQELDAWAEFHPRMDFGPPDFAVPFAVQFDGPLPRQPDPRRKNAAPGSE